MNISESNRRVIEKLKTISDHTKNAKELGWTEDEFVELFAHNKEDAKTFRNWYRKMPDNRNNIIDDNTQTQSLNTIPKMKELSYLEMQLFKKKGIRLFSKITDDAIKMLIFSGMDYCEIAETLRDVIINKIKNNAEFESLLYQTFSVPEFTTLTEELNKK